MMNDPNALRRIDAAFAELADAIRRCATRHRANLDGNYHFAESDGTTTTWRAAILYDQPGQPRVNLYDNPADAAEAWANTPQ